MKWTGAGRGSGKEDRLRGHFESKSRGEKKHKKVGEGRSGEDGMGEGEGEGLGVERSGEKGKGVTSHAWK